MNSEEIELLFNEKLFSPLMLATKAGFAIAINDYRQVLIGVDVLYVKDDRTKFVYQIPFRAIDHIQQKGEKL